MAAPTTRVPFWRFLADWTDANGVTQAKLADQLGRDQTVVGRWMHHNPRRRSHPGRRVLPALSEALGVSVAELVEMIAADTAADEQEKVWTELRRTQQEGSDEVDPDLASVNAAWPSLEEGLRKAIRLIVSGATNWPTPIGHNLNPLSFLLRRDELVCAAPPS
jgi:transcriptional regulator with XRE-family HTH domain